MIPAKCVQMKTYISLFFTSLLLLVTGVSCEDGLSLVEELDNKAVNYSFNATETYGFDDFSSAGACLGIAIDNSNRTAIVIGLKFTLPLFTKNFEVVSSVHNMIEDYQWGTVSTALDDIVALEEYTEVQTNTAGIRTMDQEIVAFLIKYDSEGTKQYFIAYKGSIQLVREDGPSDTMEGDLSFVQISEAGPNAEIVEGGEVLSVKNIFFNFSTQVQPD